MKAISLDEIAAGYFTPGHKRADCPLRAKAVIHFERKFSSPEVGLDLGKRLGGRSN
jgi:hypothetical protein